MGLANQPIRIGGLPGNLDAGLIRHRGSSDWTIFSACHGEAAMEQETQALDTSPNAPAEPPRTESTRNRRRWVLAGGGTVILLVAGAALMQVFRGGEGIAAESGRAQVSVGATAGQSANTARNLATVGKAIVTYDQVAKEAMARYGTEVLDQLINRTIIEQACKDRGLTVSEAEVEQEITKIAQDFGLERDGWLRMLQAERNITPLQYKRDIIWPMLALKKLAGSEIEITEADIKMAFERDYGAKVKVRMIMMDNPRRMDEVRDKAVKIRAAAGDDIGKAAAEFGKLAREYSIEPSSKSLDGVVPPIRRHTGPQNKNVEDAAFSLEAGELSGIVQMPTPGAPRYVLLFCEGHTDPVVRPEQMNLVRDQIIEQLKKEKVQERVAHVFQDLKETTPVHNFLTNESTGVRSVGEELVPTGIRPVGATSDATPIPTKK